LDYKPKNSILNTPWASFGMTWAHYNWLLGLALWQYKTLLALGIICMEMCESLAANNQTTHKKYKKIIKFTEILGQVTLSQNDSVHVNVSVHVNDYMDIATDIKVKTR
jgi:hypothetical protein